jgi:hypothetical protein
LTGAAAALSIPDMLASDASRQRRRRTAAQVSREAEPAPRVRGALDPRTVLALQRSAGNQAVGRLMRQERRGPEMLDEFVTDSVSPETLAPEQKVLQAPEEAGAEEATPSLGRMLLRKEEDTKDLCPRYYKYDAKTDISKYNCAGLAWRTYTDRGDLDAERAAAAGGSAPAGKPGEIKHWFWEYDLRLETDDGALTGAHHDFHTVAGVVDKAGKDPDDVYTKNGYRPVFGPGTGPGWKPADRDQARSNDASNTAATTSAGKPIYKKRWNVKEIVKSHPCPK